MNRNVLARILRFVCDDFRLLVFEVDSFVFRDIDCARGPKSWAILLGGSLCRHVFGQAVVQGLPVTLRIHNIILYICSPVYTDSRFHIHVVAATELRTTNRSKL